MDLFSACVVPDTSVLLFLVLRPRAPRVAPALSKLMRVKPLVSRVILVILATAPLLPSRFRAQAERIKMHTVNLAATIVIKVILVTAPL